MDEDNLNKDGPQLAPTLHVPVRVIMIQFLGLGD